MMGPFLRGGDKEAEDDLPRRPTIRLLGGGDRDREGEGLPILLPPPPPHTLVR